MVLLCSQRASSRADYRYEGRLVYGKVSRRHLIFVIESARGAADETASVASFGRSPEGAPFVLGG